MTLEQLLVFAILAGALVLFIWGRWRYDLVAAMALLATALTGLVPPQEVFLGFGHPAVITVAAVLVLSRGLVKAGVVDMIARVIWRVGESPLLQMIALTGIVALLSAFMNNIGALALLMAVAITISRRQGISPSLLLMPLAFGSLLGGMMTLIGTPPNIIIATYRAENGLDAFRMFDFLPVGGAVALVGLLFISLVGWRLVPLRLKGGARDEFSDLSDYITEVRIQSESEFADRPLRELMEAVQTESEILVLELYRNGEPERMPPMDTILRAGNVLLVEADDEGIRALREIAEAELVEDDDGGRDEGDQIDELELNRIVVTETSPLVGDTVTSQDVRRRHGINVVAVARQGGHLREQIRKIRFEVDDILLVQGSGESVLDACGDLACLPLADQELSPETPRRVRRTLSIFGGALLVAALGWLSAPIALTTAALLLILVRVLSITEAYRSVEMPVIILLAAMIPVGGALENTGGAQLIADALLRHSGAASPAIMLTIIMVSTMLLANIVKNAAATILVAPIALDLARALGASADPFLMAVAIGASAAFLTPIGHPSCILVMMPGGYRFSDYWRLGLPLSILVVVVAVPMLMWVWPPFPG